MHSRFNHLSMPNLQLGLGPVIKQVAHLEARPVGVQAGSRPLAVPSPLRLEIGGEVVLKHLDDVLAEDGEELEAVEVAAGGDIEALGCGVGGDNEV